MVKTLLEELSKRNLTLSSAESLTGGLFASTLVDQSGISKVFKGGIVTYWSEIKNQVLHVDEEIISKFGVVSKECAYAMAENCREMFSTSISVSFTGNAGPETLDGKPVGEVFIAVNYLGDIKVYECHFLGSRLEIRKASVDFGIKKIIDLFEEK